MAPSARLIPKNWRRLRVFIGGDYDFMANLREIEACIPDEFETVLAYDYEVPKEDIHDTDIRLLSKCGYAIFECTSSAGQLMELERTADFNVEAFVIYQVRNPKDPPPAHISSMISTMDAPMFGYSTFRELRTFLRGIFPAIETNRPRAILHILDKSYLPTKYKQAATKELDRALRARKRQKQKGKG
jgi:hypothetical protein